MVPVLPPSAPFEAEQRAWLNGFLAGIFGMDTGAVAAPNNGFAANGFAANGFAANGVAANGVAANDKSLNRVGSDSGGNDLIAAPPSSPAAINGVAPAAAPPEADNSAPWHDPNLELDERIELAQGRSLPMQLMAAMAQLDCGQCGYLCQSYAAAIADGSEKSLKKCIPGAKPTANKLKELMAS